MLMNDLKNILLLTNGAKQGLAWVGNILFSTHRAQMTFGGECEWKSVTLLIQECDQKCICLWPREGQNAILDIT